MASRKIRQLSSLGSALQGILSRLGLTERMEQEKVLVVWAEVVGPRIAAATRPERVRDGILFVTAKSNVWAHELITQKMVILKKLEVSLGKRVVSDIRFSGRGFSGNAPATEMKTAALPEPDEWKTMTLSAQDAETLQGILTSVSDPELRERLGRVASNNLCVRRWREQQGWRHCRRCGLPHPGSSAICGICQASQGTK